MKLFNLSFLISFMLVAISFALSVIFFYDVEHLLVVHFDIFKGIDFFGGKNDIFLISAQFLALIFINSALSRFLYTRISFLAWSIASLSVALGIINLVSIITVIINN